MLLKHMVKAKCLNLEHTLRFNTSYNNFLHFDFEF